MNYSKITVTDTLGQQFPLSSCSLLCIRMGELDFSDPHAVIFLDGETIVSVDDLNLSGPDGQDVPAIDVDWDDEPEDIPQPEEQPKTYEIQVGRDARIYFRAEVTGTIQDIQDNLSRHGYVGEINGAWKEDGVNDFENVETFHISDPDTEEVVASWSESNGWEEV